MIITDIHAHVFPDRLADKAAHSIGDFYGTPMYSAASVDRLLAEDGEADISYSVICNSAVTPHQVHDVNNFLAAAAASHPSFIGFGSIYPGMDGFEEELDRMMALGLRGLKIHPEFQKLPIDDPSGIETYRAVAKRGLPVLFHRNKSGNKWRSFTRALSSDAGRQSCCNESSTRPILIFVPPMSTPI